MRPKLFQLALSVALVGGLSAAAATQASASSRAQRSASARPATARSVSTRSVPARAARCAANRAAGAITFVSPFGFDASAGIIDVFAAQALGYFADECLAVHIVTNSRTPTELVSAGAATITGEGSAADDLLQVAAGQHVTAIATFGDASDYALLTAPKISSLTELEGQKVAYHEMFPAILDELLQRAGVPLSSIDFVNDTTYNPTLLDAGAFDAVQAYQSNEPLELSAAHLGYHEFTPERYKLSGTFNIVVANTGFLEHHRSVVADFLRADLHGFAYCTTHVVRCVAIEAGASRAAGSLFNASISQKEWKLEDSLAIHHHLAGEGVGVETSAEWRPEAHLLASQHLLTHVPKLTPSVEDTSLAAGLYRGTRLVWPGI